MSEISKLLQDGIQRKGWSTITEAAEKIGVERTFLNRLLKGDPPRRKRGGSRMITVEPDERYQRMAAKLGLGDDFLKAVAREQEARPPKQHKITAPQAIAASDHEAPLDEPLQERYPDLWSFVESEDDLRGEVALLRLAETCLTGIRDADAWKHRLRTYRRPERFFEAKRHDRLGSLPGSYRKAASVGARTCRRIAEAITDDIDLEADEPSQKARIQIASFFFELAYCRFH